MTEESNEMFIASASVRSDRILYTPSDFAKTNLFYLQEIGKLTALAPHTSQREKMHSCLCFVVLKGSGTLTYDGVSYKLGTRDIVFLDCHKPYSHSTDSEDLWTLQWCHFYGANAQAIASKYFERGGEPVIHSENSLDYEEILRKLYDLAKSDDYIRDMRMNEHLSMLLTHIMEESWHPEKQRGNVTRKLDVKKIKTYVDENYKEKITLESIAELHFINKHYLARLFKEQYGLTLTVYIQQVRITHAKRMLRFTDQSIEAISFECGFRDLSYFSRVFKKFESVSPSKYRNVW